MLSLAVGVIRLSKETILSVEEITFDRTIDCKTYQYKEGFDGVRVTTDQHVYEAGISNDQNCCEYWGYTINEDKDAQTYVGATLIEVKSDGTFTNFETDRGTLNFTCYNEHNGYYSHACVLSKDGVVIESDYL